jgi:predicted metal-dependent phosphoesterase TrpH
MNNSQPLGRADVHMHTSASDGLPAVREVLDYVARRGHLDVMAITDHDVLDASLEAYEQRPRYPFDIIPGVEVTSAEGHMLGLWVTQPIPMDMSLAETASAIHEQGGIAILAHPFHVLAGIRVRDCWRYLRNPQVLLSAKIDALEVHNAAVSTPGSNRLARRLGRQLGITVTGSSDAHALDSIGSGLTRFVGRSAQDFRNAIARGQTLAEGSAWPITDYLKLAPRLILGTLNASLATNRHSTRPTRP